MKSLRITAPEGQKDRVIDILDEEADEYTYSKVVKDGESMLEYSATVLSEDVDGLIQDLKDIKEIDAGDLSIRILEQNSLIRKGSQIKGPGGGVSKEEVYSKAKKYESFSRIEIALVGLSASVAAYGLALNNLALLIGAMMLAPMLAPFVSSALSISVGDLSLMKGALSEGATSVAVTIAVGLGSVAIIPIDMTPAMRLVASPGLPSVLLALMVGSAAALSFATGAKEQIAGVAVAIALVPPLAAVGIGIRMLNLSFSLQAASVAAMNLASIVVAGFATFRLLGFRPSTYYRKKKASRMKYILPAITVTAIILVVPGLYLNYTSQQAYSAEHEIESEAEQYFGDSLMDVSTEGEDVEITVIGEHNETAFQKTTDADVDLIELERAADS
ncbi:TIGR00341 family protein [Nanohaloarchaea archaeon]|nr:TIGR00341 family protein [Candidatus Nanohaloarchaea archaeon]